MKINFFCIISGIVSGIIVEDDAKREFGNAMGVLFFEVGICTFEGLIAGLIFAVPVLKHADVEEVKELIFLGGVYVLEFVVERRRDRLSEVACQFRRSGADECARCYTR
ncbi:MAG: hypothetical protein CMF27_03165 [Kiritimatiellaceae bacterium]|nr:hypothetical protein [Kiritimatiellaceae bacterium]